MQIEDKAREILISTKKFKKKDKNYKKFDRTASQP